MHRAAAIALSFGLLAAPSFAKTKSVHSTRLESCTSQQDRTAFDTEGLKSELMVTAETCKMTDRFNEFMNAYKPAVAQSEGVLSSYFHKAYGRQSQKAYDDYITNLANVQSQEGLKSGTAFCTIYANMFDEVMSLHDSTELVDYAHGQAIVQPLAFTTCSEVPVKALSKPRHKVSKHRST